MIPDVNVPTVLSAESSNGYTITLSFNERVDANTAAVVENYVVNEGTVDVVAVEPTGDRLVVALTPGQRVTHDFAVSVSSVRDLAGNEIAGGAIVAGQVRLEVLLVVFGTSGTSTHDNPADAWNNAMQGVGCFGDRRRDSGSG